jgi:hypothetical protein
MRHPVDIAQAALTAALMAFANPVAGQEPVMPEIPTEAEKIMALKLGYVLNGDSMVRWGSIDLSKKAPAPEPQQELIGPLQPADQLRRKGRHHP